MTPTGVRPLHLQYVEACLVRACSSRRRLRCSSGKKADSSDAPELTQPQFPLAPFAQTLQILGRDAERALRRRREIPPKVDSAVALVAKGNQSAAPIYLLLSR
jgi:hypothetical protein